MKGCIVAITACAGMFALAQTAYAGPAGPIGEAWADAVAPGLLTRVRACRGPDGNPGQFESYIGPYGRQRMKCVSYDYHRVENRSPNYTNSYPQPWGGGERGRWDDKSSGHR